MIPVNWVLTENYKEWIFEWLCLEYLHKYTAVQGHLKQWVEKVARLSCQGCQKVSSSRLIINSRQLWNSHQRHKFIRAKASRDIWKIRVSEMAFSVVFKRYFPPWMSCCFVRIHARPVLGTMPSKCPSRSKTPRGLNISRI